MKSKHIFWGGTADRRGSTGTSAGTKAGALALEDLRGHMQIVWTREGHWLAIRISASMRLTHGMSQNWIRSAGCCWRG
jgi:hypothetical protein